MPLTLVLYVAAGSALGGVARFLISNALTRPGSAFPWSTLGINILGALLVGLVTRLAINGAPINLEMRLFLTVGFCGGFTTFSAFSYEVLALIDAQMPVRAASYALVSVVLSLLAVAVGVLAADAVRGAVTG
jgi:CrcB protein